MLFNENRGQPKLRMRHMTFKVGALERDRWLVHMLTAVNELAPDENATNISDVKLESSQKRALIFGSERAGLSTQAIANADALVRIEMNPEVDSLNVAAAAAISCYALR